MIKNKFKIWASTCLILSSLLLLNSCETTGSSAVYEYKGPGSEYSISLDTGDSTFTVTESESSMTVNGTYTTLDSGFTKLTVGSATGDDAPSAGEKAYGIDVPGYLFLLKPISEESEIISMIASGSCPTEDFTTNWIITSIDSDSNFKDNCVNGGQEGLDSLGTFAYTHSTTTGTLPSMFDICGNSLDNTDDGEELSLEMSCSDGKATITDSEETIDMYLSQIGGMLVKFQDNKIIIALPPETIASTDDFIGDYIGLVMVDDSGDDGSKTFTIKGTMSSDSTFSFDEINVETNEVITSNTVNGDVTFAAVNNPSNGFISGTFTLDAASTDSNLITCTAKQNVFSSGKNFIFCIGESPQDDDDTMFNVLLISKD